MFKGKTCSNLELKNALLDSLEKNNNALDYIENNISNTKNKLGFSPDDIILQEQLKNEEYIKFCLNFLDDKYSNELKKLGVVL